MRGRPPHRYRADRRWFAPIYSDKLPAGHSIPAGAPLPARTRFIRPGGARFHLETGMARNTGSGAAGQQIIDRCDALAELTEDPGGLTRTFGSARHRQALDRIAGWMQRAGMTCREDPAGNLIGRYEADEPGAARLMMGSHQDTVRNGGRYDGMLGIVAPISAVELLHRAGERLPFAVEVVAFTDEEGVRFQTTLLGSKAIAGTLDPAVLEARDGDGVSVAEAMRTFGADPGRIGEAAYVPGSLLAFVETHIEQGPRLEAAGRALGVVTAIAGGTRLEITLTGEAGHAGTVPMGQRRDALSGAAEAALAIERYCRDDGTLVGTIGRIAVGPGAINVIPGTAVFTTDIRAPENAQRRSAVSELRRRIETIAGDRGLACDIRVLYDADGCECDPRLVEALSAAVAGEGCDALRLHSGAGHDAMAMAAIAPVGMLFVRCRGGISHHPDESITAEDADAVARVLRRFLRDFRAGP